MAFEMPNEREFREKAMLRHPARNPAELANALVLAHKKLDEAVLTPYGWKSDLSDEEILEKLLALNLERAK